VGKHHRSLEWMDKELRKLIHDITVATHDLRNNKYSIRVMVEDWESAILSHFLIFDLGVETVIDRNSSLCTNWKFRTSTNEEELLRGVY
jgi:hypothetical protein